MNNRFEKKTIVALALLAGITTNAPAMKRKGFDGKQQSNEEKKNKKRKVAVNPNGLKIALVGGKDFEQGRSLLKKKYHEKMVIKIIRLHLKEVLNLDGSSLTNKIDLSGIQQWAKNNAYFTFKITSTATVVKALRQHFGDRILTNLRELYLSNNKIKKIENLNKLTNLRELYLSNNKIKKIENLNKLTNLRWLDLPNNQITKIENLPNGLNWLYLSNNQITKIENLPNGLDWLYLSNNQIKKIESLPNGLKSLDLSNNQIKKIENLPNGLEVLFLSNNKVTKADIKNIPANVKIFT